jgi:hypothetical protein
MGRRMSSQGRDRGQSVIEFLSAYSWSFVILIVLVSIITVLVLSKGTTTYSQSYCYITPGIDCQNLVVMSNGTDSKVTMIFLNGLGTDMHFANGGFSVTSTFVNGSAAGSCYPANVPSGGTGICNATINGYAPGAGSQIALAFSVSYRTCDRTSCGSAYNTSGTGTSFVSPYHNIGMRVTLLTSPVSGNVILQGAPYPSNTELYLLEGVNYNVYAQEIPGYEFGSWVPSGINITVTNPDSISTTLFAEGNGTITATYAKETITTASTSTSTSTTIPAALSLAAPSSSAQYIFQVQSATISDTGASGGVTPYSYQWLEEKPGAGSFSNATDCAEPATDTCVFSTTTNTVVGTYQFELKATDSGNPALFITSSAISVPVYQSVPVTLTNSQGSATPAPFQQMINITESSFGGELAYNGNMANFEYIGGSGQVLPSWIEDNSSGKLITWVNLPSGIPANGAVVIYLGFAPLSTNLLSSSGTSGIGEAPQLSSTYAEYDDGASVFGFYDNFAGAALNASKWSSGTTNGLITVDNGVRLNTSTGGGSAAINFLTAQSTNNFVREAAINLYGSSGTDIRDRVNPSLSGSPSGSDFGYYSTNALTDQAGYFWMQSATGTMTPAFTSPTVPLLIDSEAFTSAGTMYWNSYSYGSYAPIYSNSFAFTAGTQYTTGYSASLDPGGAAESSEYIYWVRIRTYPPGGVMPSVTID